MQATSTGSGQGMEGLRVVELASDLGMIAGKLLADMGADVVLVEPPGGHGTRMYEPFYKDEPHPERSLWFWYYNTSKRAITVTLENLQGRDLLRQLLADADVLIECERPGRLAALGLGYADLQAINPKVIVVSITPYGQDGPDWPTTDLTLLAEGGPVWSCGYDDHSLPPMRGADDQVAQVASDFAVVSTLTALLYRQVSGRGQHIDVSAFAAANVSTEGATYQWMVAGDMVQRQTGRHAAATPTMPAQFVCQDGRYVSTGIPPRLRRQFRQMIAWMERLELADSFPLMEVLKDAAEGPAITLYRQDDAEAMLKLQAGREAFAYICQHLDSYDIFIQGQESGNTPAIVYSPEEALEDPHIKARGFPVEVEHPELGETFTYPGAPYQFKGTPWAIRRRAPLIGEDNAAVFAELGVDPARLDELKAAGVV